MRHSARTLTLFAAAAAGVTAAACRDLAPNVVNCLTEQTFGTFHGRAGGQATDSLMGCAYFSTDTPSRRFGMLLTNGGPRSTSLVVRIFLAARPETAGTFSVGALTGFIFLGDRQFTLTSGAMNITYANLRSRLMDGTVNLTGTDAAGASVTVTGLFAARCVATTTLQEDRPRDEWSALCDHQACFPFQCAGSIATDSILGGRRLPARRSRDDRY